MGGGTGFLLRDYHALHDAGAAYRLWEAGGPYSFDPLVFVRYVSGRVSYCPGDATVAERNGQMVGIGVLDLDRRSGSARQASVILVLVYPGSRRFSVNQ